MELQRRSLSKNGNKAVLCNKLLKALVNNPPILNDVGDGNKAGGTQVIFSTPKDV